MQSWRERVTPQSQPPPRPRPPSTQTERLREAHRQGQQLLNSAVSRSQADSYAQFVGQFDPIVAGAEDQLAALRDPYQAAYEQLGGGRAAQQRGQLRGLLTGLERRRPEALGEARNVLAGRQLETAGLLEGVLGAVGAAFDGNRFIRHLVVEVSAQADTAFGAQGNLSAARERYRRQYDRLHEDLPRPLQIAIDEMSPGNIAVLVASAGLSSALIGTGTRGGVAIGRALQPFAGPLGFTREVAGATGARLAFEATEGAPLPVRVVSALPAAVLASNPDALLSPASRAAKAVIKQSLRRRGTDALLPGSDAIPPVLPREIPQEFVGLRTRGLAITTETAEEFNPASMQPQDALGRAVNVAGQSDEALPPGVAYHLGLQHTLEDAGPLARATAPAGQLFVPSVNQPRWLREAYVAEGSARAEFATRIFPSRLDGMQELKQAFGGLDDAPRAILRDPQDTHALAGKLVDVLSEPERYILTPEQRRAIGHWDWRNSQVSLAARDEFGVDVGEFGQIAPELSPSARPRAFVPIVDQGASPLTRFDEALRRSGAPAVDRTDLMAGRMAERSVESTSLRAAMEANPDLNPVTDVRLLYTALDDAKTVAVGRNVMNYGVGGQINRSRTFTQHIDVGLRPRYFTPEEGDALRPFFSNREDLSRTLGFLESFRQGRLGGDASPLTIQGSLSWFSDPVGSSYQLVRGISRWMSGGSNPFSAQTLADDIAKDPDTWVRMARSTGIPITAGTPQEFAAGWLKAIRVPGTRASLADLNEATFNALLRRMKTQYESMESTLIRFGVPEDEASAAAADVITKIVPMASPRKLGLTPRRAGIERLSVTSASFIRQPPAFFAEAVRGLAKGAIWAGTGGRVTPRPSEILAAKMLSQMVGGITATAAVSAALTADQRGLSMEEAVERAITPGGGDFWKLQTGSFSLPLGGPWRGFIQLGAPGDRGPIERLLRFAQSRVTPFAGLGLELARNKDFYGEQISDPGHSLESPENMLNWLWYVTEQTLPVSAGSAMEEYRRGSSSAEVLQAFGGEFLGTNLMPQSEYDKVEESRRRGAAALVDLTPEEQARAGMTPEQVRAAAGSQSLEELRNLIGTRAANAVTESQAPGFAEAQDEYIAELERRAERGDASASALLIGVRSQRDLAALEQDVTSTLPSGDTYQDRFEYRRRRPDIIRRAQIESELAADIFDSFGESDSRIDQLSSEWWDLWDKATITVNYKGEEVDLGTDYVLFEELENQLYARIAAEHTDLPALVEANVGVAPRNAPPLERELRQVRRDLELNGFWSVADDAWREFRSILTERLSDDPLEAALAGAAKGARNASEFRSAAKPALVQFLLDEGVSDTPEQALAQVERRLLPRLLEGHDNLVMGRRILWSTQHLNLAAQAVAWDYMGPGILEAAQGEEEEGDSPIDRPSLREPSQQDRLMAQQFIEGQSYGQLGIRYSLSAGAVEQRLRRYFGGSPSAARTEALSTT